MSRLEELLVLRAGCSSASTHDRSVIAAAREAVPALLAVATAALAREQAEEALAEWVGTAGEAAMFSPAEAAWRKKRDRLETDRALAVAALRAALQPLTGGMR